MTQPNNHTPTDNQNEQILASLRIEIADLKSQRKKKDDRIATLDVMLNQIMESHHAEVRAYEDLEDKLEDVVEMLRRRVPHGDILAHLKVKDSNEYQFKKLW
jgi:NTP pyrophosphatase (non-canonical NTP hydrolase)